MTSCQNLYGRFLTIKAKIAPITTIATMIAMDIGMKYVSDTDGVAVGIGVAVGCASITVNAVVADDGQ